MSRSNEKYIRRNAPELITGVDIGKVNSIIGSITQRDGQIGKTKSHFSVTIKQACSVKEIQTLAKKLQRHHRLRIKDLDVSQLWRDHIYCSTQ